MTCVVADCVIGALDLPQATLTRVRFEDSRADEVDTRGLRAEHLDLRGLEAVSYTDPPACAGDALLPPGRAPRTRPRRRARHPRRRLRPSAPNSVAGASQSTPVESTDIPHSGTYTRCRTYRRRRPWPTRRFPTSPPSRVSKRSGMPRGPRTARTCSIVPRRRGRPRRHLQRRHSPADRLGEPAHRPRLQLHAHRRQGALRAHARQDRVLPDGLGRQRPAHRAPRAELLRRALRSVAAVRRRASRPRSRAATTRAAAPPTRCRSAAATSSSCARSSPSRTRSTSRRCGASSA